MKRSRIGVLAIAALCLSPCAHAEQHGTAYAAVKAIIDYCGQVDAEHRNDYKAFGANVLSSITGAGDSANYQTVYDAVTDALRKTPEEQGRTQCEAGIGVRRDRPDRDDR